MFQLSKTNIKLTAVLRLFQRATRRPAAVAPAACQPRRATRWPDIVGSLCARTSPVTAGTLEARATSCLRRCSYAPYHACPGNTTHKATFIINDATRHTLSSSTRTTSRRRRGRSTMSVVWSVSSKQSLATKFPRTGHHFT